MRKNIKYGEGAFMAFGKWQATLPEEPNYLYCTGPTGEGLYIQRFSNGNVKQIKGLGQFRPRDFNHFKFLMRKVRNSRGDL